MDKFDIEKVSISEATSNFTGETRYIADVNIGVKTVAKLSGKGEVYVPKLDLSKDSKINAIVIYSKEELDMDSVNLLTGQKNSNDSDSSRIRRSSKSRLRRLQRNTIVEIKKLSQIIRGPDGELLKDLFVDHKQAQNIKAIYTETYAKILLETGEEPNLVPLATPIKYSFSFRRDLDELYKPGEVKNLYVAVVPILYASKNNKPPKIQKSFSLIQEQVIRNDIFVGNNEDLRKDFYENLFSFDLSNTGNDVKSMSSDLFPSYGKKSQVKGMFAIDKLNILRNMSVFGGLLDNKGIRPEEKLEIIKSSQILDLKIKRQKIKRLLGFAENRHLTQIIEEKISQNFLEETIVSSREEPDTNTLNQVENKDKQDNLIGEMGELNLNLAQGIKFVGFNDFDTSQEGLYQYCLDMSMKDGIRTYIENKISSLIDQLKILENYYGEKFINKSEAAKKSNAETAAKEIAEIAIDLNNEAASLGEDFTSSVVNLINYQQSLLNLIEFTNDLLKKLQDLSGINTNQVNISKSKSVSKNNTDKSVLYYSTKFSEYVDFTELKNINYDYIGIQQNDQIGVSVISKNDTVGRFSFEFFTKLINSGEFDGDFDNLQRKIFGDTFGPDKARPLGSLSNTFSKFPDEEEYFDLSQTYYSYLSPINIRNQDISNSNVFDADFFNDLHYQEIEDTDSSNTVLLYEIMSSFGISISSVFYKNLYKGDRKVSSSEIRSPNFKNYDGPIDNREDFIPLVNSILQKEENWSVSKDNFTTTELKNKFKRYMPNHIRVLFGGKSDACKNKWLSTEGDYFDNANTYYMMKQNFMNLVEIEVITFGKDANENIDLKNTSYRLLSDTDIENEAAVICKSQNFQQLGIDIQNDIEKISYPNKYFIIEAGQVSAETGTTVLNTTLASEAVTSEITNDKFVATDVPDSITKPTL